MANFENFQDYWGTRVYILTKKDRLKAWMEFVEKCDETILKGAVDDIAEIFKMKKDAGKINYKPNILDLEYAYQKVKHEHECKGYIFSKDCSICGGKGRVVTVMKGGQSPALNPSKPVAQAYPNIGIYDAPCTCAFTSPNIRKQWPLEELKNNVANRFPGTEELTPEEQAQAYIDDCEELLSRKFEQELDLEDVRLPYKKDDD